MANRKRLQKAALTDGQFVFAKMRGFRAWPGRLVNRLGNEYNVYFYGTCNHAKVAQKNIFDYAKHSKRYGKLNDGNSKTGRSFRSAMLECQLAMAEPNLDAKYFNMVAQLTKDGGGAPQHAKPEDIVDVGTEMDAAVVPPKVKRPAPIHIVGDSDSEEETNSAPN